MLVDGQVVAKTSSSLRIPNDWIVPIEISGVKGTSLELKWPQVSVQIATLEVLYEKGGMRNIGLYHINYMDNFI